jgi:hypothetical protein
MIPENTATPPTADRQAFKASRTSEVWDLCAPDAALMSNPRPLDQHTKPFGHPRPC